MEGPRSGSGDMVRSGTDRTVLLVFLATIALGGSNAVAIRVGNAELPPFWNATLRFGLAAVLLAIIAVFVRPPLPRGRTLLGVVLYGVVSFAASYAFAYVALVSAPAGVGQLIISIAPLLTLLLAVAHRLERFRWQGLAGSLIAAPGILIVFGDQLRLDVPIVSLVAAFAAAVCIAEGSVLAKLYSPGHPVSANAFGMAIGAAILGTISLLAGETWTLPAEPRTWASVLYLASVGSVALFLAFLFVLRRWTASATSYVLLLMPLWTVTVGALALGEAVSSTFILGAVLILGGTYIGAFLRPRRRGMLK